MRAVVAVVARMTDPENTVLNKRPPKQYAGLSYSQIVWDLVGMLVINTHPASVVDQIGELMKKNIIKNMRLTADELVMKYSDYGKNFEAEMKYKIKQTVPVKAFIAIVGALKEMCNFWNIALHVPRNVASIPADANGKLEDATKSSCETDLRLLAKNLSKDAKMEIALRETTVTEADGTVATLVTPVDLSGDEVAVMRSDGLKVEYLEKIQEF